MEASEFRAVATTIVSSGRTYENVGALGRKSTYTYLGDINYSISVSHFAENGTQTSQSSRQHGESKENIIGHLQVHWKEVSVNLHNSYVKFGQPIGPMKCQYSVQYYANLHCSPSSKLANGRWCFLYFFHVSDCFVTSVYRFQQNDWQRWNN